MHCGNTKTYLIETVQSFCSYSELEVVTWKRIILGNQSIETRPFQCLHLNTNSYAFLHKNCDKGDIRNNLLRLNPFKIFRRLFTARE